MPMRLGSNKLIHLTVFRIIRKDFSDEAEGKLLTFHPAAVIYFIKNSG